MDPLYAKAHGKVGGSTTTKSTKSKKKKRSARTQSAGQSSGRPQLGTGEPTSESGRSRSKRSTPDGSGESNSAAIMMNAMHVLDIGLGIAYIIGATTEPGTEATAALISLGAVLLLGSLCGAVGYFSKSCNRAGLLGSVIVGVVAFVAYTGTFIWALVSWDSCVAFFDQDELFGMGDKKILTTVVLAAVAVFECIR